MEENKNPTLSGIMNAIITSVSRGRQAADLEAMKSAMAYQKIDLLKGIPVPRMRINNVKISIPMILSGITQETVAKHTLIPKITSTAKDALQKEIESSLNWINSGIDLISIEDAKEDVRLKFLEFFRNIFQRIKTSDINSFNKFQEDLNQRLLFDLNMYKLSMNGMVSEQGLKEVIGQSTEASILFIIKNEILRWIKEEVVKKEADFNIDHANNSIDKRCNDKIVQGVLKKVKFIVESNCIATPEKDSELEVLIDTERIKNAGGGPDTVTRLSFTIREEGLEWITEVHEDKTKTSTLSTE